MPGPIFTDVEWERCLYELTNRNSKPDYIVASGSLPPGVPIDFYARIALIGKEINAKVIVDASGKTLKLALAGRCLFN